MYITHNKEGRGLNTSLHQRKKILEKEFNQIKGILEEQYNVGPTQSNDPYIKKILEILQEKNC